MAITVEMRTQVSQLYVALFGRAPDAEGLGFWVGLLDSGTSLNDIANTMFATTPARAYYPSFLTNEEIVASFYENVLGRPADAEGLAFWTAKMNEAGATPGSVINHMITIVANYTALGGTDPDGLESEALFNNKVEVAQWYGENSGTIEDAHTVLASVTSDPASVEAIISGWALSGETFALTAGVDNVLGTVNNDIISGIFGEDDAFPSSPNTYTNGDVIDGGDGHDTLNLIAQTDGGVAVSSNSATVKNVETINIRNVGDATFDSVLVQNAPAINFTNTTTGNTSSVINAALGSVMGLQGQGDLDVAYTDTSGTSDTALVSLTGTGTSATARSTVDVSNGNTIEAVNIATAGTNFVALTAGAAAADMTVTGSGTNNFDISAADSVAAVVTVDASAATGNNTFVMGTSLSAVDTIMGGSGSDTVDARFAVASLVKPNMTGIETLKADFDALATVDLSGSIGLQTVTLAGSSTDATLTKAASSVTTLNVSSVAATGLNVNFGYTAADKGALTMNIGSTATTAADIDLGDVTLTNTTAFTLNTVGTKVYDIDYIDITGDQTAVAINANSDLDIGSQVWVDGDIGALDITVGAGVSYSGGVSGAGSIGDVNYTVGDLAYAQTWISAKKGDIGNVTIVGNNGEANMGIAASGGGIESITVTLDGHGASGSYLGAYASGGAIGDINISVSNKANMYVGVSADAWDFTDDAFDVNGTDGNIGNITLTVGDDSYISANFTASGGSIGDITVNLTGENASGNFDFAASQVSGDINGTGLEYVRGGHIGNIVVNALGDGSNFDFYALASGGNMGTVDVTMADNTSGFMDLMSTMTSEDGAPGGSIGAVTIDIGEDSSLNLDMAFDHTLDSITGTVGYNSYLDIEISGGNYASGAYTSLGDISIDAGDRTYVGVWVSGFAGSIGNTTLTLGDNASGDVHYREVSGAIGNVDITAGDFADILVFYSGNGSSSVGDITVETGTVSDVMIQVSGGSMGNMGTITLIGGDVSSSAGVWMAQLNTVNSVAGVDASDWAGYVGIGLDGVTLGTTISVGTGGSWVQGAEGADFIYLGAGADTVYFDGTPTSVDEIFSFQKAQDALQMNALAASDVAVADDAAAVAIVTNAVHVYADGSNTVTAQTITDFNDMADVAAFLAASFTNEANGNAFAAVINDGGGTAYVYDVIIAGTLDGADDVVMVGVVHADGALTIANTTF